MEEDLFLSSFFPLFPVCGCTLPHSDFPPITSQKTRSFTPGQRESGVITSRGILGPEGPQRSLSNLGGLCPVMSE